MGRALSKFKVLIMAQSAERPSLTGRRILQDAFVKRRIAQHDLEFYSDCKGPRFSFLSPAMYIHATQARKRRLYCWLM
jgi:hypothetical protein